jgi:hypothetical protein
MWRKQGEPEEIVMIDPGVCVPENGTVPLRIEGQSSFPAHGRLPRWRMGE